MHRTRSPLPASLTVLVLAFTVPADSFATGADAWGPLLPGPWGVGFRVLERPDHSRPFAGGTPRPIQMALWYPTAQRSGGERMTLGDVAALIATERGQVAENPADVAQVLRQLAVPDFVESLDDQALATLLEIPTAAIADAPPADGSFPLLLWGKGEDGHALDHALLNEYLASHGYVVASTPALPSHARRIQRYDATSVRTQLRDLEHAVQALHLLAPDELPADLDDLGLLAWSFGGLPAALLQMRNVHIRAVVSHDSRIGYHNAPEVFSAMPDFGPSRVTAPVLHLTGTGEPRVDRLKDPSFLEMLRYAGTYRVTLDGVRHRDFNFFWAAVPEIAGLEQSWPRPPVQIATQIAEITLRFLDATLKGSDEARRALEALSTRPLPAGIAEASVRAALPAPPSSDDFLWTLSTEGIAAAASMFRSARQEHPGLELFTPSDLLRRCRDLIRAGSLVDAQLAGELVLEQDSSSAMAHYLLAQIATAGARAEDARHHYERTLEVLEHDRSLEERQRELIRRDVEERLAAGAPP